MCLEAEGSRLTFPLPSPTSHSKTYVPLNLDRLQHWIDRGLIDPSQPITAKELLDSRCIHSVKDGVKILGDVSFFASLFPPPFPSDFC